MRSHRHLAAGAILGILWIVAAEHSVLGGEKIEITPASPSSKSSLSPLTPRGPSKLDLELDRLEGARIQMIQPAGPGMSMPAPVQRPAEDNKKKNWLLDSAGGDKPLDYNGALGVRDYSGKSPANVSGRSPEFDGRGVSPARGETSSGRYDFNRGDGSRRDALGRNVDGLSSLDGSSSRNGSAADALGGLRESSVLNSIPNLSRNSDRDLEQMRNRSALKAEVDGILNGTDSRLRGPMGNTLSVESILRPPGSPGTASSRPRIDLPVSARPTASPESLGAPVLSRDLTPSAAFNKQGADALSAQRPKLAEPERTKNEQRYRPAVLPFPKRGF